MEWSDGWVAVHVRQRCHVTLPGPLALLGDWDCGCVPPNMHIALLGWCGVRMGCRVRAAGGMAADAVGVKATRGWNEVRLNSLTSSQVTKTSITAAVNRSCSKIMWVALQDSINPVQETLLLGQCKHGQASSPTSGW